MAEASKGRTNRLANKAIAMILIMIVSKALGFLRDVLLANKFGTSDIVDAYTVAITLPSVLFAIFVSGLNQSYLPFYTRIDSKKRRQEFFSNTLVIYILLALAVTAICFLLKEPITFLLSPGFDNSRHALCTSYVGIIIWMFPFYSFFALMSTQLQTQENFSVANFCDFIVVNVVIIASILVASPSNDIILAIGYSLSMIIACFILFLYFIKNGGTKFTPRKKGALSEFKDLLVVAIPVGLSFMVNQLNSVTDSIFSSTFSTGVISGLNYANKIQSVFLTLTTTVFMTIVFPRLNTYFAQKEYDDGMYYIKKGLLISSLLSIPFAAFIGFFSKDLVIAVFQRGAFDEASTVITAGCLEMYAIGIPFYAYVEIGSRTLTALMKQKLILRDTCIAVAFNIFADYALMKTVGYVGLSMATSISGLLLFTLYFLDIRRLNLKCFNKEVVVEIGKIIIATIIATVVSYLSRMHLFITITSVVSLFLSAMIFGIIYLLLCISLRISIIRWMFQSIKRK